LNQQAKVTHRHILDRALCLF